MINVKVEITTESGDPMVNINQRCKENRLEEVLKAALAAFEGTDGSERFVFKGVDFDSFEHSPKRLPAPGLNIEYPYKPHVSYVHASSLSKPFIFYNEKVQSAVNRAMAKEFGKDWRNPTVYTQCHLALTENSPYFQIIRNKGEDSEKVVFNFSK